MKNNSTNTSNYIDLTFNQSSYYATNITYPIYRQNKIVLELTLDTIILNDSIEVCAQTLVQKVFEQSSLVFNYGYFYFGKKIIYYGKKAILFLEELNIVHQEYYKKYYQKFINFK